VRELEDWMRVPGDERDLLRRVERLELHYCGPPRSAPLLDQGVLRVSDSTVVLSPAETSLVSRLLADFERVVPRAELERSVWGQLTRSPRALDSLVSRCRRSIEATGLTIAAVRGRGFTLAVVDDDDG
jgi:DNA-binding response OmpR family regulator